jgi:hypothetical protein
MPLNQVFSRFIEDAPLSVMVQGTLENIFHADAINDLFERTAQTQYTRDLLFSTVMDTMTGYDRRSGREPPAGRGCFAARLGRLAAGRGRSGRRSSSQPNKSRCFWPKNRSAAVVPSALFTR